MLNYQNFIREMYESQEDLEDYFELWKHVDLPPCEMTIHNSTFEEMLSEGSLHLIQNDSLKNRIVSYYKSFKEINKHLIELDYSVLNIRNNVYVKGLFYTKYMGIHQDRMPFDERKIFYRENEWSYINKPNSEKFQFIEEIILEYHLKFSYAIGFQNQLLKSATRLNRELEQHI